MPPLRYAYRFLVTLAQRLTRRGFLPDDPYVVAVNRAADAVHHVMISTHYLSCDGGVGEIGYLPDAGKWLGDGI